MPVTRFVRYALTCLLLTSLGEAAEMSITLDDSTAVIRIGDEVVGTYRHGNDLPKPYLIAVSAPGALDLLTSELDQAPTDEFAPGNKVFVAVESSTLVSDAAGQNGEPAAFGDILDVDKAHNGMLRIAGTQQWISARDIVPVKAMVTRIVDSDPPKIKERPHPLYYDHPHHKGIWNSVDEVNGIKFWNEDGRIVNTKVGIVEEGDDAVELAVENHWLDRDGEPLVREQTRIRVTADRLFTYDITFSAVERPVVFDDTKEGMFAIRMPNSMREMVANGPVVNADGLEGTSDCWGRTSPWVDYAGPVGEHIFGVALMDHPDNPRRSRYHVRNYGLFGINPFGQEAYTKGKEEQLEADPLELQPGESIRFRYGLYVHRGDAESGSVAGVYEQFTSGG